MLSFTPKFGDVDPTSILRGDVRVEEGTAVWSSGKFQSQSPIWSSWPGVMWLHNSVIEHMVGEDVRGVSSYPASLIGKSGDLIQGYHGLVVFGRCGAIDFHRSERIVDVSGKVSGDKFRGIFFDEVSWDGSDVFMCRDNTCYLLFSQRAKDCLEPLLSNVEFEPLTEIVLPCFAVDFE